MKKANLLVAISVTLLASSCASIFTSAKQSITFVGDKDVKIYDNGQKIATIGENGETSVRIRKKLSSKELVAKKDGYKPCTLTLESRFNPISCLNLLNILGWGIDLGTQKVCKWDNTYIEVELEEDKRWIIDNKKRDITSPALLQYLKLQ